MPEIKLPDGKKLTFEKKVSGLQIAEKMCLSTFTEYKKLIELS